MTGVLGSTEATTDTTAANAHLGEEQTIDEAGYLRLGNEMVGVLCGAGMNER